MWHHEAGGCRFGEKGADLPPECGPKSRVLPLDTFRAQECETYQEFNVYGCMLYPLKQEFSSKKTALAVDLGPRAHQ